jgi:hypothetical protein
VTPRLATHVWVGAYLARLRIAAIPAVLRAKGDAEAGAVIVSLATMDGRARAFQRRFDFLSDSRVWGLLAEGTEAEVEAVLARARARDPDLWIVEIEDPKGRTLLDDPSLG